jgi:hypothetical protein
MKGPRKRPPETGTLIGVRLQPLDLAAVDEWASKQQDQPSRPEAIRRILALHFKKKR